MASKSPKTKSSKPLTISIHGADIDIDAKFHNERLSELLAETISRVSPRATASPTQAPASSPMDVLVYELGKTFTKEQLDVLMNMLSAEQKLLFMEIMNSGSWTTDPLQPSDKPEHDFDVVQRVIKAADQTVLQAIITLAKDALAKQEHAS